MKNKYKVKIQGKEYQVAKGDKVTILMPVEIRGVDKENNTLEAIFSSQDEDRHGDVVMQDGWDLKNFKKNPVILNSHNYDDATEVVGKASNVKVEAKKLQGKIQFAVDENPKAKVIFDLYAGKYLNAFSVGFMVKEFAETKEGNTDWYKIKEAELLEVSAVSVPANARALAKQKGLDLTALTNKDYEQSNDEPGEGDKEPNEVPEDPQVPEANGEPATGDGDDSKDGEDPNNEETPGDAGDTETKPDSTGDDPKETPSDSEQGGDNPKDPDKEENDDEEVEPEPEPKQTSYKRRVVNALNQIEETKKRKLKQALSIINSLVNSDPDAKKQADKAVQSAHRRKVNRVIRLLMQSK